MIHYHNETKHHFNRYARSSGFMDWDNQPNPFRHFEGAPILPLPFMSEDATPPYPALYENGIEPVKVRRESVGQFFELSLGLSAWKSFESVRWPLRMNPSSGNLHPTEGYAVLHLPELGPDACVCHYTPAVHALEVRTVFSHALWSRLTEGLPQGSFFVGLSSIHWREAWKYGERAYRYCQHDVGHAIAGLRLSAATLGWKLVLFENLGSRDISELLGLERESDFIDAEREHPDLLAACVPGNLPGNLPLTLPEEPIAQIAKGIWKGVANKLSTKHVSWPIIDSAAQATGKPRTDSFTLCMPNKSETPTEEPRKDKQAEPIPSSGEIIRQRRSAASFDGETEISSDTFFQMLERTLPFAPPWDAVPWEPKIHLCLFVHRVRGLKQGLYILVRDPKVLTALKSDMKPEFIWQKPEACPDALPLYLLQEGHSEKLAVQVSCLQAIAGDSAFSLGMLAEFEKPLREYGAWYYPRLFWETGMIGQILYLEAEFAGVRGTGIGCFFDNPVLDIFGLSGMAYQSLYHFTVGGPVEDTRLTTLPPYSKELATQRR
ncbi:MAG: SagB/ThcOx family dehydrogenase [Chlorobiales bacterium]|nr:SagB/ThcOx family dehydrogenase [Chlorobiales bacterium]